MIDLGWTDERTEEAKRLWLEGFSAAQIAKKLGGVTRNAVLGKLHRQKVGGRDPASAPRAGRPKAEKPVKVAKPKAAPRLVVMEGPSSVKVAPGGRVYAMKPPLPISEETLRPTGVDSPNARVWSERRFGECAFPVDGEGAEALSCCNPTSDRYCAGHAAIMYQPSKGRNLEHLNPDRARRCGRGLGGRSTSTWMAA